MTIAKQVKAMIERLEGTAICDNCITETLHLSVVSQANNVTRPLAQTPEFERLKTPCGQCGVARIGTRATQVQRV